MCLIAFDWRPDGDRAGASADEKRTQERSKTETGGTPSLLLVSNRDEYFNRPSQSASYWSDRPEIYAGRDLQAGGTWLATSTNNGSAPRLACVTNYHSLEDGKRTHPRSRGEIVSTFVGDGTKWSAREFAEVYLRDKKDEYAGFSALLFDGSSLVYCSNRDTKQFVQELAGGLYGLSNHLINTPWPKVEHAKRSVARVSRNNQIGFHGGALTDDIVEQLFSDFRDTTLVEDSSLLPTTLGDHEEYLRSAVFVRGDEWGTRTTTIVSYFGGKGFDVLERNHETPLDGESSSREFLSLAGKPNVASTAAR